MVLVVVDVSAATAVVTIQGAAIKNIATLKLPIFPAVEVVAVAVVVIIVVVVVKQINAFNACILKT